MDTELLWSASAAGQLKRGSVKSQSGCARNSPTQRSTSPIVTEPLPSQSPVQVVMMTCPALPDTAGIRLPARSVAEAAFGIATMPGDAPAETESIQVHNTPLGIALALPPTVICSVPDTSDETASCLPSAEVDPIAGLIVQPVTPNSDALKPRLFAVPAMAAVPARRAGRHAVPPGCAAVVPRSIAGATVAIGVGDTVAVSDAAGVRETVAVRDGVTVRDAVAVCDAVRVGDAVGVRVDVRVSVAVGVLVGVAVAV